MAAPEAALVFDYTGGGRKISVLEPLIGQSGTLTARRLTVKALETEDYILLAGVTADGHELDEDQARRLFNLSAQIKEDVSCPTEGVQVDYTRRKEGVLGEIAERNAVFFAEEMTKLERGPEGRMKIGGGQIQELDYEIKQ